MSIHLSDFQFFEMFFVCGVFIGILFIPLVLIRKRQPVSAIAWSLTVVVIPYLGVLFFLVFGASQVKRRLRRKLFHRARFLQLWNTAKNEGLNTSSSPCWAGMDQLTFRVGGSPPIDGNNIHLFEDGIHAFESKFAAIREAKHHVHLQYFIFQNDETGKKLIDLLCEKAAQGIQVRLLLDAIGSRHVRRLLSKLRNVGGKTAYFLPTQFLPSNLFSGHFTLGLRNHRKILICDGNVGFVGGLNIGDEYVCKSSRFGYWRDTHMKISGPAVLALQRVFVEDWDFAANELLASKHYFPIPEPCGSTRLQIVWAGPDQENNAIRETCHAVITSARQRLWIATPYLIPDGALLATLRTAALRGVDVRILTQSYPPDHWITYWAGRYFWEDFLSSGIRIYEYNKGMMHAKIMIADGAWGSVGSANLDIRSIRLNFEINAHIHSPEKVAELESAFEKDLKQSREIKLGAYHRRPIHAQLLENICRLFSPLL